MSEGKVGVERDGPAVGSFGDGPVPAEPELEVAEGGLDLGEVGFCGDGAVRRHPRACGMIGVEERRRDGRGM